VTEGAVRGHDSVEQEQFRQVVLRHLGAELSLL
jgi:hypothetical protein